MAQHPINDDDPLAIVAVVTFAYYDPIALLDFQLHYRTSTIDRRREVTHITETLS